MAIYIYPQAMRAEVADDLRRADKFSMVHLPLVGEDITTAARLVLHHKVLLLPARVEHHTDAVNRLQQVARLCGMVVCPITAYKRNKPTPAPAARHNQPGVGVGNL